MAAVFGMLWDGTYSLVNGLGLLSHELQMGANVETMVPSMDRPGAECGLDGPVAV
mgnify:CR=1 FL=1